MFEPEPGLASILPGVFLCVEGLQSPFPMPSPSSWAFSSQDQMPDIP